MDRRRPPLDWTSPRGAAEVALLIVVVFAAWVGLLVLAVAVFS